jgi:uncharacterized protein
MHRFRLLVPLLALAVVFAVGPAAHASSSGLVVSQVYAGGGNSGASYTNDFVEVFNGGSSAADLTGWSIQYASAASTSWSVTTLTGSIQPGHHYLVQLASSGAVGSPLPAPDTTGTTNVANAGGKVALVQGTAALVCGASAGNCSTVSSVVDLVGYGTATDYEGSGAAPALSSTTAAVRAGEGCTDTGSSSADFTAVAPAPRNSASAATICSGSPPPSAGLSQDAAVDVDIQPVLSITLERPTISFGTVVAGDVPAAVSERVTVVSNNETGYALTVHRSAFTPADLPLAISGSAPAGAQIGPSLAGGALAGIPIAPAPDLSIGTTSARSAGSGDVWQTSLAFSSPIPTLAPGHYTGTLTYTLIGR